jgi:hypothetical protein
VQDRARHAPAAIKRRMQAGQGQPAGGRRPVFTDAELDAALADVSIQFVPDENWRAAREGVIDHAIQHAASLLGDRPQQ